jgi:TonB-linked SusC/RagA family outer membrane protein
MKFYAINPAIPPGWPLLKKTLLVMKLTTLLIIIAFVQVSAKTYSQVTLKLTNAPLEKVIKEIKKQTGYLFIYNENLVKADPITVDLKNATIEQTLDACFNNQPVSYKLVDKNIILQPKVQTEAEQPKIELLKQLPPITVKGRITDTTGLALVGATITIQGQNTKTVTDQDGTFTIKANKGEILILTYVGYKSSMVTVDENMQYLFELHDDVSKLKEVIVNTGYQELPKERATGSFEVIDSKKINEQVGTNILQRLQGISSLLFDNHGTSSQIPFTIRGINTINGNIAPLIVVDNFPYDGDFNNINPEDVASITILKDAAAASIWGARAGNGVVVITTKKGNFNQNMKISLSSGFTITDKPNLFAQKFISSSDYIDIEKLKFTNGFYLRSEGSRYHPYLSPIVEALIGQRDGKLTASEADAVFNSYRNHDVRSDIMKLVQQPFNQQYSLNLSGGSNIMSYFLSAGFDNDVDASNGSNRRITLNSGNTYKILKDLSITTSLQFSQMNSTSGNKGGSGGNAPYTRLIDNNGNALPVNQYRNSYLDTVGGGKLLDWQYYPADEASHIKTTVSNTDFTAGLQLQYRFLKDFNANVSYQFQKQLYSHEKLWDQDSYYIRDLVNQYTIIDPISGDVTYNFPIGGKLQSGNANTTTNNLRATFNFNHTWNKHELNILGGAEIHSSVNNNGSVNTFYGYTKDPLNYTYVDPSGSYPLIFGGVGNPFSDANPVISSQTIAHSISAFANGSYIYDDKYIVSVSGRRDATNVYGISTNNKWKPLWSAGFAWNIDKESFYKVDFVNSLKLRVTYGIAGINPFKPAVTVIQTYGPFLIGPPAAGITNFANPDLQWEEVKTLNFGFDFGLLNNQITGSLEFYNKHDDNLIASYAVDPTIGFGGNVSPMRNVANMKSRGFDISLNSNNLKGAFQWRSSIIISIHHDKVTAYYNPLTTNSQYIGLGAISPIVGQTLYPIITYKWAGLDPQTGEPMAILNGLPSKDAEAIQNNTNLGDLSFHGSAVPTVFGSINNTFSFKEFNLGVNITYKLGYYFMKQSVDYSGLIQGIVANGSADYALRWQKPGDEKKTNVPAFEYPNDTDETLYNNSDILIRKGDNVRLQFINFGYNFTKRNFPGLPVEKLSLTFNAANLGILWRSNKDGIDPDANGGIPAPKIYSLTLRTDF